MRGGGAFGQGQAQGEDAAATEGAGHVDAPVHQLGQTLGDGQPQTIAMVAAIDGIELDEGLEDALLIARLDAETLVAHLDEGHALVGRRARLQPDRGATGAELDGIAQQVEQDGAGVLRIGPQGQGGTVDQHIDVVGQGLAFEFVADVAQQHRQLDALRAQVQRAALQPGVLQGLVEQAQQLLPCGVDVTNLAALGLGQQTVHAHVQQLGEAQDGVERGAHAVAHAREELGLVGQGHLGFEATGVFGLGTAPVAEIAEHLDVVADLALGPDHALHRAGHPEGLAVLAVMADFEPFDAVAQGQGLVDVGDGGRVGVGAAEQFFGLLAMTLGEGEAGQARESGVHPGDAALHVADQDGVADAVGDQGEFLVGALRALQRGLQLADQLGLLRQGVVAHVQLVKQARRFVAELLGDAGR